MQLWLLHAKKCASPSYTSRLLRYLWLCSVTYATVPPAGIAGTLLCSSAFRTMRTPGVLGPPTNLWPEKKMASCNTREEQHRQKRL
jgi:hypothetical protein